jgi:ATP-binding cassette subfamily C protein
MMQVYDRVLTSGSIETLIALSILAVGLFLFHGGFDAVRSAIFVRLGARLDRRVSPLAHRVSLDMPRHGFTAAEAMERARTVDTLRGFFGSGAPAAIFDLPWVPIFLGFVWLLHPVLGVVTLAGAAVLAALTVVSELLSRSLTQTARNSMVRRNIAAESNTSNADVIAAMGLGDRAVARFMKANDDHLETHTRTAATGAAITSLSRTLRMVLQSALLGLGAYFALQGQLTPGAIIAVSVASSRALAPIDQVIGGWRNILAARHAYRQLKDTIQQSVQEEGRFPGLPLPKNSLSVENLTVASPATGRVLLSDVSFELKAGQAMAVVGPSGGGKSTLMRALAGIWSPLRGAVRFDDASLAHYDPAMRGSFLGYLPQEVNLFTGSIVENINRFGSGDESAVYEAASKTGIHRMIAELPEGYDTQVGAMGTALSAGQRQRIGLARALFGNPFVVLLDEPNASLDAVGERALNDTIRDIRARGGIVIVVAHRPSVLAAVDTVAVIHGGKLAAVGPKETVISSRGGQIFTTVSGDGAQRTSVAADAAV